MKDLAIALENRPGALADMGEALGRAGVSVEGGGAWVVGGAGVGHFLFEDGAGARPALGAAGVRVLGEGEGLAPGLQGGGPRHIGLPTPRMAAAGGQHDALCSGPD